VKLGAMTEAALYYGECVDRFPHGGDKEKLKAIRADQREILEKVGAVLVEAEEGLRVVVDGESVGISPLDSEIYVEPGEHLIAVERADGAKASERFVVSGGERITIRLPEVKLPMVEEEAPQPEPVQSATNDSQTDTRRKHNWVPAYVLGGLSVAALGTSVGLRVAAGDKKSKVEGLGMGLVDGECAGAVLSQHCDDLDDESHAHRRLAISSNVLLISGAALGAGAVGWLIYELTKSSGQKEGKGAIFPGLMIGSSGAQLELKGNF